MSISITPSGIIYESTLLVITCNATLPSVVDTSVTATVTWTGPNGIVNTSEAVSIGNNVFQSLLNIRPFDNGDKIDGPSMAGNHICAMNISSSDSLVMRTVRTITYEGESTIKYNYIAQIELCLYLLL